MASIEAIDVISIDADQCEAVWPLSVEAGWNQNVADWRFMLGAGRGFGCVGPDGKWQASALILPLGQKLAWISMVLVTRGRRRSGLGSGLLKHCIDEVRSTGAVAGLDATEQGRPIYRPLGFRDLYRISRWHLDRMKDATVRPPAGTKLRPVGPADLPSEIVATMNKAMVAVLAKPSVREQMQKHGFIPRSSTPGQLATYMKDQIAVWKTALRDAGIEPQ